VSLAGAASRHRGGAALLALAAVLPLAQPRQALAADAEAGGRKAELCAACHGPGGRSEIAEAPSLAGQRPRYVILALYQFRTGRRLSEAMGPFAANLTDEDLNDLAAYYAAQPPAPSQPASDPKKAEAARALTEQNHCVQCHGPGLAGQEHIPRIAGLDPDYLRVQLRGFKAATRGDIDGLMTSAAQALSESDIDLLAGYIAGLP
jgi:cytochrome c553